MCCPAASLEGEITKARGGREGEANAEGAKCMRVSAVDGGNAWGRCFLKLNTKGKVSVCGKSATDLCSSAANVPWLRARAVVALVALIGLRHCASRG